MSYSNAQEKRQAILDYLWEHPGAERQELAAHLGCTNREVGNWITQCLKAGEIRANIEWKDGRQWGYYWPAKKTTYWAGPGSPEYADKIKKITDTNSKKKPTVGRVIALSDRIPKDDPNYQPAEAQSSSYKAHIGSGSFGVV